jgi:hypothetical protein
MKRSLAVVALACLWVEPVLAEPPDGSSGNAAVAARFQQLTQDWENAVQARDIGKLSQIEADGWRSVGPGASVWTKQQDLAEVKSGAGKHVLADLGPVDAKMLGDDVAVVQGILTDRSSAPADNAGARALYVYMDVWVKRGNKWSVVRSQSARVK